MGARVSVKKAAKKGRAHLPWRHPTDSQVETTHVVLPPDTNSHGTAFGGKIMQWMDITAGIAAGRHSGGQVVTVAVDDLHFRNPIRMGDIVIVRAVVNHAGKTSMEVGVRVDREDITTQRRQHCLTGYFIFVAVTKEGKPRIVPAIVPQTDEEERRFADAEERRLLRLKAAAKM